MITEKVIIEEIELDSIFEESTDILLEISDIFDIFSKYAFNNFIGYIKEKLLHLNFDTYMDFIKLIKFSSKQTGEFNDEINHYLNKLKNKIESYLILQKLNIN
jgi:hypothetical protein